MNKIDQTPGIHHIAQERLNKFSNEEERIVYQLAKDWFVTNTGEFSIGNNSQYRFALIKATPKYREAFGLERELIVIFSDYDIFQSRSIDAIDKLLESVLDRYESLRIERICSILFSKDKNIKDKISKILKESQNAESQVVIPISYEEILQPQNANNEYFLVNKFREHFYARDLFDFTSPLRKDLYFFGRTDLINKLGNRHFSHENSSIFGLRRSGKTSLVFAIQRQMDKVGCPSVFIACDNTSFQQRRWNECLHYILNELVNLYRDKISKKLLSPLEEYTEKDAALVFEKDLRNIHSKLGKQPILLVFDEIERITFNTAFINHWKEGLDFVFFWQTLKSVFNSSTNIFSYLIVGTNPACIETAKIAEVDNPIFQSVSIEYLDRFDVSQTRDMVGKLGKFVGLDFEESIYTKLTEDYGGHPFLIRQACSFIYQKNKGSLPIKIDRAMYLKAKDEFETNKARGYIKLVLEVLIDFYPDEHFMLTLLAVGDTDFFNKLADSSPEYVTHLVGYGIISKNINQDGYDFRIDAVQKYLQDRNKYKSLNLTVQEMRQEICTRRIELEIRLREIIRMKILGRYNKLIDAHKIIADALKNDNRKKNLQSFAYKDLFDPSKVNIFLDVLRTIVIQEWEIFEEIFVRKEEFNQVMQSLNKYRRIDAHSYETVTNTQFTDFRVNIEWIETRLVEWKKLTG
jgi:hypothetical protein